MARAAWRPAVLGMMVMAAAPGRAAADGNVPAVAVEIRDAYAVSPAQMEAARSEASRIYAAAGVSLVWMEDGGAAADGAFRVHVTLLSDSETEKFLQQGDVKAGVLGLAPAGTRRVYVFCGRIARRAAKGSETFTNILGRVLAHEIGHQLLPGAGHSATGLMRAWVDYRSPDPPPFTTADAASIRIRLTAAR